MVTDLGDMRMVVTDSVIEQGFEEPGKIDLCEDDPYSVTSPESVIAYLEEVADRFAVRSEVKDAEVA